MATFYDIRRRFTEGEPLNVAIMGNSIGCGFRAVNTYSPNEYNSESFGLLAVGVGTDSDNRVTVSGQHDSRIQSWAIQLMGILQSQNASSTIQNVSINGGHMAVHSGTAHNSANLLDSRDNKPDAVILPLQINESLYGGATYWKSQARILIEQILAKGWVPILMKENDIYDPSAVGREGFHEIIESVDEIAHFYGLGVIDGFTAFKTRLDEVYRSWEDSGLFWDNIHPNQAGHNLLAMSVASWFFSPNLVGTLAMIKDGASLKSAALSVKDGMKLLSSGVSIKL